MSVTYLRSIPLLLVLGLSACSSEHPPAPGIYFWQSDWDFTTQDARLARNTGFSQLYVRMLDIDYDPATGQPVPRAPVQLPDDLSALDSLTVIPVVYIVNEVFRHEIAVDILVDRLLNAVDRLGEGQPSITEAQRLQIDCDWTPATRDAYFSFLKEIKDRRPATELSVTVRLHQYRERERNGIPPAYRGLLMCYNMTPVQDHDTRNAIFDLHLLAGYLNNTETYPLPLDAALPLFTWGAAFRDDRFLGLVDYPEAGAGLLSFPDDRYLVVKDTTVGRLLLRAGDEVRGDGPGDYENLRSAVQLLRQRDDIEELLFYDWRPDRLTDYRVANLITEYYD